MPAGTFPVPPDVRTERDFTVVKGVDQMLRTSAALADPTNNVDIGEWMSIGTDGLAVKATAAAVSTAPLMGAKASWTLYRQGNSNTGQSDAMSTGQVDLLSAPYQAKTKLYDTGATYTVGAPLVVIHDGGTDRGILSPLDPAAADAESLAGVVGTVISGPTAGVLHFEAK